MNIESGYCFTNWSFELEYPCFNFPIYKSPVVYFVIEMSNDNADQTYGKDKSIIQSLYLSEIKHLFKSDLK